MKRFTEQRPDPGFDQTQGDIIRIQLEPQVSSLFAPPPSLLFASHASKRQTICLATRCCPCRCGAWWSPFLQPASFHPWPRRRQRSQPHCPSLSAVTNDDAPPRSPLGRITALVMLQPASRSRQLPRRVQMASREAKSESERIRTRPTRQPRSRSSLAFPARITCPRKVSFGAWVYLFASFWLSKVRCTDDAFSSGIVKFLFPTPAHFYHPNYA